MNMRTKYTMKKANYKKKISMFKIKSCMYRMKIHMKERTCQMNLFRVLNEHIKYVVMYLMG